MSEDPLIPYRNLQMDPFEVVGLEGKEQRGRQRKEVEAGFPHSEIWITKSRTSVSRLSGMKRNWAVGRLCKLSLTVNVQLGRRRCNWMQNRIEKRVEPSLSGQKYTIGLRPNESGKGSVYRSGRSERMDGWKSFRTISCCCQWCLLSSYLGSSEGT